MPESPGALALFAWLSPAFPTGAFAYSHGLEWAIEAGDITDEASLTDWLGDLLTYGSLRSDAVLLALAHCASQANDDAALITLAELGAAFAPTAERCLETVQQGNAFRKTVRQAWPCGALDRFAEIWQKDVALPVAVGVAAAGHGIERLAAGEMFAMASVSNLISAAIRLGVIGQTGAQCLIAGLAPACRALALSTINATLDDLGGCAIRADIASARHETQYTRLFRS